MYGGSEARQPDVWAYTSLMKGYVKKGRLHDVERVFNEFISRGGKPTEVAFVYSCTVCSFSIAVLSRSLMVF